MNARVNELKLLAVGDLHGKNCWQTIDVDQYDRIVFMGDYVDSLHHSDQEILDNLKAVISLKKSMPEKIILLLGNHDSHYLYYPKYSCSGFRPMMQESLTEIFIQNQALFQVTYQIKNHLFSHAGISMPWYQKFQSFLEVAPFMENLEEWDSISEICNAVEKTHYRDIIHQIGAKRGGSEEYGGMTWADKEELWDHPLEGYHQVVGHTPVSFIEATSYNEDTSVTFVDVLDNSEVYYEMEIPLSMDNYNPTRVKIE